MIESIITSIVGAVIPAQYLPVAVILLTAFLGLEQWLASTNRIQANSTLQLIVGVAQKLLVKFKG